MSHSPELVLLIHGTGAHRRDDSEGNGRERPAWWQTNGEFCKELNRLLQGAAECWRDDACDALPWTRPRRESSRTIRLWGRRLFAWTGAYSDRARRHDAERLLEGLLKLEADGRHYHLVAHSHGGTVTWLALQFAAARGEPLEHLLSWTTLGTPFPTFRVIRGRWLLGLFGLVVITLAGMFALAPLMPLLLDARLGSVRERKELAYDIFFNPHSGVNLFRDGFATATKVLAILMAGAGLWFLAALGLWLVRTVEHRRDRRTLEAAWKSFGPKWLGLYSKLDEAISGVQGTINFRVPTLVRVPWPSWPPRPRPAFREVAAYPARLVGWLFGWVVFPCFNWVVMPLAEWLVSHLLSVRLQSADRFGTELADVTPEPVRHVGARGQLPAELRRPLHQVVKQASSALVLRVRRRFAEEVRSRAPREILEDAMRLVRPGRELVHNAYLQVPAIRRAVAAYILKHSLSSCAPRVLSTLQLDPPVEAWLDRPPAVILPPAESCPNSPGSLGVTPRWTRFLLALAFAFLLVVSVVSIRLDLATRFVAQLIETYARESAQLAGRGLASEQRQHSIRKLQNSRRAMYVLRTRAELPAARRIMAFETDSLVALADLLGNMDRLLPLDVAAIRQLGSLAHHPKADEGTRIAARAALLDPGLSADPCPAFDPRRYDSDRARESALAALGVLVARRPDSLHGTGVLIHWMQDSSRRPEQQVLIIKALRHARPTLDVVLCLIAALNATSSKVSDAAVEALGSIGAAADRGGQSLIASRAVAALVAQFNASANDALLSDALAEIGQPALGAILVAPSARPARLDDERILDILKAMGPERLDDEAVVRVIAFLGDPASFTDFDAVATRRVDLLEEFGRASSSDRVIPALYALDQGHPDDPDLREDIADALTAVGYGVDGSSAYEDLLEAPIGGAGPEENWSGRPLRAIESAEFVDALLKRLREHGGSDEARALARAGNRALRPLLAELGNRDPRVRRAAAQALGLMRIEIEAELLDAMEGAERDRDRRVAAIDALGWIASQRPLSERVIRRLLVAMGSPDPAIRGAAASGFAALFRFHQECPTLKAQLPRIITHSRAPKRWAAAMLLLHLDPADKLARRVLTPIAELPPSGDEDRPLLSLIPSLLATADRDLSGRTVLARAWEIKSPEDLGRIARKLAIDVPVEGLREALNFDSAMSRRCAIEALAVLGARASGAVQDLRRVMLSERTDNDKLRPVGQAAAWALLRIGPVTDEAFLVLFDTVKDELEGPGTEEFAGWPSSPAARDPGGILDPGGYERPTGVPPVGIRPGENQRRIIQLGDAAVGPLRRILRGGSGRRATAVRLLGLLGDKARPAIPELIEVVQSGDDAAREGAWLAITDIIAR
jgi:hypothetical protein